MSVIQIKRAEIGCYIISEGEGFKAVLQILAINVLLINRVLQGIAITS